MVQILLYCGRKHDSLPELETRNVTDITSTTAKSGGVILLSGTYEIISKGICWNVNPNPDTNNYLTRDGSGPGNFESTLLNLDPGTEYYIRAYATTMEGTSYANEISFTSLPASSPNNAQIIADHTVVDKYDDIPQYYINEVKKMWLVVAGESHSQAYRDGLSLLEMVYPLYDVNITEEGTPETYTTTHLRASRGTWGDLNHSTGWIYSYGEEDWTTSTTAINRTKAGITYCNSNNLTIGALGFGWCYDFHVDATDYIEATKEYIDHCEANSIPTKVFFTTGPVDDWNGVMTLEDLYIGSLQYNEIRDSVLADNSRILFDYADILCYDDNGSGPNTATWNGHMFPIGTEANVGVDETGHITNTGALRLAKAMWWMLARIAGWDGE